MWKTTYPQALWLYGTGKKTQQQIHMSMYLFLDMDQKKVWLNRWMGTPEVKVAHNSNKVQHFSLSIVFWTLE